MRKAIEIGAYMHKLYPMYKTRPKSIIFQVTDDCNLACKYCFVNNKSKKHMTFDIAKHAIDLIFDPNSGLDNYFKDSPAVILDFIGGEPLLEIELIDQIVDYFRIRTIELDHKWKNAYSICMTTNGITYFDERVQKFLDKNIDHISLSISLDGCKECHDSCRVFPDGSPSFDLVEKAVNHWRDKGKNPGTKFTISPDNIKYLDNSLRYFAGQNYKDVFLNTTNEKGWTIEHASEIYKQMKSFVDWYFKTDYDMSFTYFEERCGKPLTEDYQTNFCGTGINMLSVGIDGKFYPCNRLMSGSIGDDLKLFTIGDVYNGYGKSIEEQKIIQCFQCLNRRSICNDTCYYCPIASNCGWCLAYNYIDTGILTKRTTYNCEISKARALINCYYWNKYYKKYNIDKVKDLWVPKQWAIPIIGEEEYNRLVSLVKSRNGYVNDNLEIVKGYKLKERD